MQSHLYFFDIFDVFHVDDLNDLVVVVALAVFVVAADVADFVGFEEFVVGFAVGRAVFVVVVVVEDVAVEIYLVKVGSEAALAADFVKIEVFVEVVVI